MKSLKKSAFLIVISFVIAIFFVLVGRDSWEWQLFINGMFYFDIAFVTLIVIILLTFLIWQDGMLNNKFSWFGNFWNRLLNQFLFGVIIPVLMSIVLVYIYMEYILQLDIFNTTYFKYELPISGVFFILFNLILVIIYLLKERKRLPETSVINKMRPVVAQKGKNKILIDQETIQLIEKTGVAIIIFCKPIGQFLFQGSLEDLEGLLEPHKFFRANRQAIVNRENCKSFHTERSGKVILNLNRPEMKQLTISQKKAKGFKSWLTQKK